MKSFADIPAEVQRRVDAGERVILMLLDAFGLEFLDRHRDHPLIEHLDVTSLASQFSVHHDRARVLGAFRHARERAWPLRMEHP